MRVTSWKFLLLKVPAGEGKAYMLSGSDICCSMHVHQSRMHARLETQETLNKWHTRRCLQQHVSSMIMQEQKFIQFLNLESETQYVFAAAATKLHAVA